MLCADVMKTHVFTCSETDSARRCAELMRDHNIGFVPVASPDGRVVGVVTDRDLAIRVLAEGQPPTTKLGTLMTREIVAVVGSADLRHAEECMARAQKSRLLVVDDAGRCVGVISLADIAQTESRRRAGQVLREVTLREAPSGDEPVPTGFE